VIILVFDTLSACHLSLYGYRRETTPNLAQFARRALVYHNHYAGGNFTTPGTASLLTGTYPWTHRAFNQAGRMNGASEKRNVFALLGNGYDTIAYPHNLYVHVLLNQTREDIDVYLEPQTFSLFDDMFYRRFLSGDRDISFRAMEKLLFPDIHMPGSLFLALAHGIKTLISISSSERKFERLYPRGIPFLSHYDAYFLVEDVFRGTSHVLSEARQPFLAYLHFFPPHGPYRPRAEFIDMFDDDWEPVAKTPHFFSEGHPQACLNMQARRYDEYVAHVDAEFGRMYDAMRKNDLLRDSYVILTSDHGELFERGVRGHTTPLLYEPIIRIPLLIAKPGQEERKDVHTPTSCVDLLPTLLHLTGQSVPDWCEGQPLPELGGERDEDRTVFSLEAQRSSVNHPLTEATIALVRGTYKLVHYLGYPGYEDEYELYDLTNDPEEMENLYHSKKSVAADLRQLMAQKMEAVNAPYRS
jgi:arylsulfatase A-like enzyme